MDVFSFLTTDRLCLQPVAITDSNFIFELVNTEGWLQFIGDRNIHSHEEAVAYIKRIIANENIAYWVVKQEAGNDKIGIVTFIQRDYLSHPDIGFAFLPRFCGKGYAYEAVGAVLKKLINEHNLTFILATTIPQNTRSIALLTKLGLVFEKEIEVEKQKLHLYGASAGALLFSQTQSLT